jgi:hypothetical protein
MIIRFPWHNTFNVEPTARYVALLGLVRLRSIALLPTFLRFGIHIERQLGRTTGVIGYRTAADPLALTFYHLSAWLDCEAIQRFVETEPHMTAVQELAGQLGITVFRYWDIKGSSLPLQIPRELHRVKQGTSARLAS